MSVSKCAWWVRILLIGYASISFISSIMAWFIVTAPHKTGLLHNLFPTNVVFFEVKGDGGTVNLAEKILSPSAAWLGFAGDMVNYGFVMIAVAAALKLCRLYQQGEFFTPIHVQLFKRISKAIFWLASIGFILTGVFHNLALTYDAGAGKRMLVLGFGSPNIVMMFWGVIAYVMSSIMQVGLRLKEDQQLTI